MINFNLSIMTPVEKAPVKKAPIRRGSAPFLEPPPCLRRAVNKTNNCVKVKMLGCLVAHFNGTNDYGHEERLKSQRLCCGPSG